jgi:uncharacterized Ntn-hydrolase superfamily protein
MRITLLCFLCIASLSITSAQTRAECRDPLVHTFSIVARDPNTGEMAVGVQSHWFSVGTIVSWGKSGVGVVATQSFVDPSYGPRGLALMEEGQNAKEALQVLVAADRGRDVRQVAFLDVKGNVSAYTGSKCIASASHILGENYSVQANMMLNDDVVPAMSRAYTERGDLPLAERVIAAMQAAQGAGGDIRGRQSAVLIVVGPDPVEGPWLDKRVDLRVEDHERPIEELSRLLRVHRAYEYMNRGDLAVEQGDMAEALKEYGAAEALFPDNLEMRFWKAVALAENGRLQEALPIFRKVFSADGNWRELAGRLPSSGMLLVPQEDLEKILEQ